MAVTVLVRWNLYILLWNAPLAIITLFHNSSDKSFLLYQRENSQLCVHWCLNCVGKIKTQLLLSATQFCNGFWHFKSSALRGHLQNLAWTLKIHLQGHNMQCDAWQMHDKIETGKQQEHLNADMFAADKQLVKCLDITSWYNHVEPILSPQQFHFKKPLPK